MAARDICLLSKFPTLSKNNVLLPMVNRNILNRVDHHRKEEELKNENILFKIEWN